MFTLRYGNIFRLYIQPSSGLKEISPAIKCVYCTGSCMKKGEEIQNLLLSANRYTFHRLSSFFYWFVTALKFVFVYIFMSLFCFFFRLLNFKLQTVPALHPEFSNNITPYTILVISIALA